MSEHGRPGHDHHDHAHSHGAADHFHRPPGNNLAFAAGIALNLAFVVVEAIYGIAANSLALLSDAGHNLSDVFALLISWGAAHLATSLPTTHRTYGMRRTSILAALVNAIVLLVVVGGIVWEAIGRLFQPEEVATGTIIAVAAVGVAINTASALLFLAGRKGDINIQGAFLHMAGDAAISLGVVIAGILIRLTGWLWLDPASSILVGAVIVWGTWGLLRDSINLALDAVPSGIDPHAVEAFLGGLPGVQAVHDLHIWGMSTTEVALTAHLVMPQPPGDDHFLNQVCTDLQHRFQIGHVTVQIEYGTENLHCRQAPETVV
jgi:cobalt-zinc-cadmium efflux system protein